MPLLFAPFWEVRCRRSTSVKASCRARVWHVLYCWGAIGWVRCKQMSTSMPKAALNNQAWPCQGCGLLQLLKADGSLRPENAMAQLLRSEGISMAVEQHRDGVSMAHCCHSKLQLLTLIREYQGIALPRHRDATRKCHCWMNFDPKISSGDQSMHRRSVHPRAMAQAWPSCAIRLALARHKGGTRN